MLPERDILKITDDMPELEKFVRQEAMKYLEDTMFSSIIGTEHPHIDSVVEKGKDVVPYLIDLYKEKGKYSSQNMYTHFFLIVMQRLYGNPFNGYVGMNMCIRYWLKAYKHNQLENIFVDNRKNKEDNEKAKIFLTDLFDFKEEELQYFK